MWHIQGYKILFDNRTSISVHIVTSVHPTLTFEIITNLNLILILF